jgi:hypothetical protein
MHFFAFLFGSKEYFCYFCAVITKRSMYMNRKNTLMALCCAALLALGTPALAAPMVMEMGVAEQIDEPAPQLSVDGNTVSVQGAAGMTLEAVSMTGRVVATCKIEGAAQRIELNLPKGCYILKVGKVVRKVTVR